MAGLELRGIRKDYGSTAVLKGIDLSIADGEFVVFVGPSGCGKSTLLRVIAGLETVTAGDIHIDGTEVTRTAASDRGLAMVFQSYALYPHMTVHQNMSFALENMGIAKAEISARVDRAARMLRLTDYLQRKPAALSGGQRQRVAIGRAIVRQPKVFLFDEPLSNLDAALRTDMRIELGKLHRALGATMIYVTHDQTEAMTLADKIVVLDRGVIQQVGTPLELYEHPANHFVAGFIGSPRMNFLPARVTATSGNTMEIAYGEESSARVQNSGGWLVGQQLLVGIRPHDLTAGNKAPDRGSIGGLVSLVERLGSETLVNVELPGGGQLIAALGGNAPAMVDQQMDFSFDWSRASFFAAD